MRTHYCSSARLILVLASIGLTLVSLISKTDPTVALQGKMGGTQQTANFSQPDA